MKLSDVAFNYVHLAFDHLEDRALRDQLNKLPTSFSLDKDQVDLLLGVDPRSLDKQAFDEMLVDLGVDPK